ncbi:MAG: GatB/YqeY domain-containing protein [Candidatus Eisenbacteria bacterium]
MSEVPVLERLQADMTTAMRARDSDTLSTLRMLKTALMEAKTKRPRDASLSPDEEIEVLQRYVKKRRETMEELRKVGREDLVVSEEREIEVTLRYLPQMMNEDELRAVVREAVAQTGASGPREMGKVIGAVMAKVKGKAEGGTVSRMVKEALAG